MPLRLLLPVLLAATAPAFAGCRVSKPESFQRFLTVFQEDKRFAVERTVYPLRTVTYEETNRDQDEPVAVERQVSKRADLATPSMAAYARMHALELTTTGLTSHAATVRMLKPDTDWMLSYHFERKGACWYLHRVHNHSL